MNLTPKFYAFQENNFFLLVLSERYFASSNILSLSQFFLHSSDVKRQLTKLHRQSDGKNKLARHRLRRKKARRKNIISAKLR